MEISSLSMDAARSGLLDQVKVSMLAKGLKESQAEAADLLKSLAPLPEDSGRQVDLLA